MHGCNELNLAVLQRATEAEAVWLVVPCCIRDGLGAKLRDRRESAVFLGHPSVILGVFGCVLK